MSEEEDLKKRVEEITTTSFNIGGCPLKTFKRFYSFCEEHSTVTKVFWRKTKAPNGAKIVKKEVKKEVNYSFGLRLLLDTFEGDVKSNLLYDRITALEQEMSLLNTQPVSKSPKTFGMVAMERKKNEVKEDEQTK